MKLDATTGEKVKFTGENSTPYQEREAKKVLNVGQIYEISRIYKGNWFQHISVKGVTGKFASEMFESCPD